ncbi:MAG: WxcM-like domain-containing protein [Patescibacteria group bacterium]
MDLSQLFKFFSYNRKELERLARRGVKKDEICGFRIYYITRLKRGAVGGGEFHKLREEILFVISGRAILTFKDCYGGVRVVRLSAKRGVRIPPYILHSYKITEDGTTFLVIANTLFDPEQKETHDTYPETEFSRF